MNRSNDSLPEVSSRGTGGQPVVRATCEEIDCESLALTISTAVSEAVGADPTDLSPLYGAIDIEVLADFLACSTASYRTPLRGVDFRYEGCVVTVFADGQVVVAPPEQ